MSERDFSSSPSPVPWVQEIGGPGPSAIEQAIGVVLDRFTPGATLPDEHRGLLELVTRLDGDAPVRELEDRLRALSHEGYLRGAVVVVAESLLRHPRPELALALSRELTDALDPDAGVGLARAVLTLPAVERQRSLRGGPWTLANQLLGEVLEERGDAVGALRHYEAVLAVDVDHVRALRGWSRCVRALEARGVAAEHRSRGLALLDGLADLELSAGLGTERYELGRPLGRGRHAVVYQAFDRRVGRQVALKRLLGESSRRDGIPARVIESRFFAEARTLARVRSPHVVALLDVQPRHRFIALELCRGGNLRLALRRGLLGPDDLPRVASQLRAALAAVHATGAVHRDVKPANILVRERQAGSHVALADFGLAVRSERGGAGPNAGTLRYLAPEVREGQTATPAADLFSAGVVLLEIATAPRPLPVELDRVGGDFDAQALVPDSVPPTWRDTIQRLLSRQPEFRSW